MAFNCFWSSQPSTSCNFSTWRIFCISSTGVTKSMKVSEREFESYARRMLQLSERRGQVCSEEHHRIFRGLFGCPFKVVSKLWNMLDPIGKMSNRCKPIHLLWTLVFLKVYKSEAVHCRIVGCKSRDTYRNWVDRFTETIADLAEDVIVFSNRFKEWDGQTRCLICIDGTDVPILEPGSRSLLWWSHKFNGPGVRYKVAYCQAPCTKPYIAFSNLTQSSSLLCPNPSGDSIKISSSSSPCRKTVLTSVILAFNFKIIFMIKRILHVTSLITRA